MANYVVTHTANEYSVATATSSAVTLATYGKPRKVTYVISATLGSSATVDGTVTGCATSGGSYTSLGAVTQLTSNGTTYVTVDIPEGVNFLKTTLTVGTAASKCCGVLIFESERFSV